MTDASATPPAPEAPTPEQGSLALAQPEDAHTVAEWEAAAAAVLRKSGGIKDDESDAVVWDRLTRTTLDGIAVTPLGLPAEQPYAGHRPARAGAWDIRALVSGSDDKLANEEALVDLDGGVTSLWVQVGESTDLATVLDGVLLDLAPVVLDAPERAREAAQAFLALVSDKGVTPHPDTNLGADARSADPAGLVEVARLAREIGIRGVVVDAVDAHDRGASDVQELGYALALGVTALRTLVDAGLSVAEAAATVDFRFAATDEQFPTIAKLRAARRLWARVLELSGAEGVDQRQHAVTSRPMLSKYDPYVNMLRGTVAAFAAGVGGADAVTVLPFDSALGRPEAFGRRIARNVSHLLIDESHVAAVADPAGGAYAVEKLTDDLAAAGWAEFQRLEAEGAGGAGGFGAFEARVAEVAARREQEIATRKRPITGLSEFPNLAETLPERAPDPLNAVPRYGASFEALRDEPATTPVFLATLGTVAQHTARASFAINLLAAGGIAVEVAGATVDAEDLTGKYRAAGSPAVVCLAGSDAAYADWGAAAADALRAAGATDVIIAGKATDYADDNCAMGIDALAFLRRVREKLA